MDRIYSKIHRQITRHDWESPSLVFPHYMYIRMHMWWHIWLVNRGFDSFFRSFYSLRHKLASIIFHLTLIEPDYIKIDLTARQYTAPEFTNSYKSENY